MSLNTYRHNGYMVTVDTTRPSVAAMLSLPPEQQWTEEQWVEPAIQMVNDHLLNNPNDTVEQALAALNVGATWLWIGLDEEVSA